MGRYGFSSAQGYLPNMATAFSVVTNVDVPTVSMYLACRMTEIVAEVINHTKVHGNCSFHPAGPLA